MDVPPNPGRSDDDDQGEPVLVPEPVCQQLADALADAPFPPSLRDHMVDYCEQQGHDAAAEWIADNPREYGKGVTFGFDIDPDDGDDDVTNPFGTGSDMAASSTQPTAADGTPLTTHTTSLTVEGEGGGEVPVQSFDYTLDDAQECREEMIDAIRHTMDQRQAAGTYTGELTIEMDEEEAARLHDSLTARCGTDEFDPEAATVPGETVTDLVTVEGHHEGDPCPTCDGSLNGQVFEAGRRKTVAALVCDGCWTKFKIDHGADV